MLESRNKSGRVRTATISLRILIMTAVVVVRRTLYRPTNGFVKSWQDRRVARTSVVMQRSEGSDVDRQFLVRSVAWKKREKKTKICTGQKTNIYRIYQKWHSQKRNSTRRCDRWGGKNVKCATASNFLFLFSKRRGQREKQHADCAEPNAVLAQPRRSLSNHRHHPR